MTRRHGATRHAARRTARGFTLLEVLVAFTLLAVVLGAMMEVFAGGMRNAVDGEDRARAVALAEALLTEAAVPAADASFAIGASSGEYDGGRFRWQTRIEPLAVVPAPGTESQPAPVLGHQLVQIAVVVEWESWGRSRAVTLSTWRVARRSAS